MLLFGKRCSGSFKTERQIWCLIQTHTGVNERLLRSGFQTTCEQAEIPFGLSVEGGVIWHDLRRTFAAELRARQYMSMASPIC
jgi:hypothetical protein